MNFWDREKEKKWLKHYLLTEPNAILFVYGPKSSGKTTLLMKVVEEISKDSFIYYWFDLREKFIVGYESVVDIFFKKKGWLESFLRVVKPKINLGVFELEPDVIEDIRRKRLDPFEEMRKRLEEDRARGLTPVIVFDELQKLKDIYLNGGSQRPLIKELFNFFVRLTKVLHLAHVIVMTSDTFFIEQVYTDSTLKNTSRFYLVDFFDDDTAVDILMQEGMDEDSARKIISNTGGVPWILGEILSDKENLDQVLENLYLQSKSRLYSYVDEKIEKGEDPNLVKDTLVVIMSGEIPRDKEKIREMKSLVEREILFYDPLRREVKFQTRLDEKAAKELLEYVE